MKFRLAETYLLKAEACIQLGDTKGAKEAINAVRNVQALQKFPKVRLPWISY